MAVVENVLSLTVKLCCLRIVILATVVQLILLPSVWYDGWILPFVPFYIALLVYHFASAFQYIVLRVNMFVDLICLLAQMAGLSANIWYLWYWESIGRWAAQVDTLHTILIVTLLLGVSSLAFLRLATIFKNKGQFIMGPDFDILTNSRDQDHPGALRVLIGRSIFNTQLMGENIFLRVSRGVLAVSFILAIICLAVVSIVLEPIRETALTPVKEIRTFSVPLDFTADGFVWNVVVSRVTIGSEAGKWDGEIENEVFHSAVNVTLLEDSDKDRKDEPCTHTNGSYYYSDVNSSVKPLQTIAILCPTGLTPSLDPKGPDAVMPLNYLPPDLLITVNYTKLGISPTNYFDTASHSVSVIISLSEDRVKSMQRTLPTTLPPGVNVMGTVRFELRQILKRAAVSAFGVFESFDTFLISRIGDIIPDPLANYPSIGIIPRAPDISTLRVFPQNDPSEWKMVMDYRDKSVLNGFSGVGGLWTFLSGVFTVIFGSSLMRVLFGMKPIGVVGLAHNLQRQDILDACHDEYPQIQKQTPKAQRGVLALLQDHLIDVEFLRDSPASQGEEVEYRKGDEETGLADDAARLSTSAQETPADVDDEFRVEK